ncbi:energy transducer TonB [Sphingomonas sp. LT1P40]|uniref:energy transducer TonB n=1 Tax=Alteristakelama amylovorans TaxID=3096166 RepID=UPI002FC778CA
MTAMILSNRRQRIGGAAAALAVTGVMGVALVLGLAVRSGVLDDDAEMALFSVAPERVKPKVRTERMKQRNTRPSGAAAPPNLRSRATELEIPKPLVPIVLPSLMTLAEKAADGAQATSGAALVAGPGTGAGGVGDGFGGGGDGDGDGAGDPDAVGPRQTGGRIRDSDYPEDLSEAGIGGLVTVLYVVEVNGRVPECEVLKSSGTPRLDALTCRLIRERFKFRPSKDGRGRAVPSRIQENHEWVPPVLEP